MRSWRGPRALGSWGWGGRGVRGPAKGIAQRLSKATASRGRLT